jgi:rhodanese-related sulfurtransferase
MLYKTKNIYLLLLFSLVQLVCLEDSINPPVTVDISNPEDLLIYLESKGDYINSPDMPSIISAEKVYTNRSSYLIIDIRTRDEFVSGHIEGAVNISHEKIIGFLDTTNISDYHRILIVSSTGQEAAYYNSYLRLYGFNNSYSLGFGMASWNQDFASIWGNASIDDSDKIVHFTTLEYPKNRYSDLPNINFRDSLSTIEEKTKKRIVDLMKDPYNINLTYFPTDYYIICFAAKLLYYSKEPPIAHPENAVSFTPPPANSDYYIPPPVNSDLRSVSNLQTLPNNKPILLYSYSGQLSSYAVAYLRLLGYDAKNLSFGTHSLFYSTMKAIEIFEPYTFTTSKIMNYPYAIGNK